MNTDTLLNNKYRIGPEIGRGRSGIVYRAVTGQTETPLAIKILFECLSPGSDAFAIEYAATGKLTHPHIVPALDFGHTSDGRFYWVMPYIDAIDWNDFQRHVTPETVTEFLVQTAHALEWLHGNGIIHGDIKPANILIEKQAAPPGFNVRLADFGLAHLTLTGRATFRGGSLPYLAPENLVREWIDPRSDLFSLGITLAELITGTGKPPFNSVEEYRQLTRPNQPVAFPVWPEPMKKIGAVAESLMAPDPDRRMQSARDVIIAAGAGRNVPATRGFYSEPVFTGRDTEKNRMLECAATLNSETTQPVIMVYGPPGSGKTRLLREFYAHCRLQDINCRYYAAGGGTLLHDAQICFDIDEPVSNADTLENRVRTQEKTPVIHIVDDINRADDASVIVFRNLLRHPPPGILFICAGNTPEPGDSEQVHIHCDRLTPGQIRKMIRSRFVPAPPESLIETLAEHCSCLPGNCNRTLDVFMRSGIIAFSRNAWRLTKTPEEITCVFANPEDSWFQTLADDLQVFVSDIACISRRIDPAMIESVLDMTRHDVLNTLKLLVHDRVIENVSGEYLFIDHELMTYAAGKCDEHRRKTLNQRAADYILKTSGDRYLAGIHQYRAREFANAVENLFASGVQTIRSGNLDAGISIFRMAESCLEQLDDQKTFNTYAWQIALEKGNALVRTGNNTDAINAYQTALEHADKPEHTITISGNLATVLFRINQTDKALERLHDALFKAQEANLISQQGVLYAQTGNIYFHCARYRDAENAYNAALPLLEQAGNDRVLSAVWNNLGSIRETCNDLKGAFTAYTRGLPVKKRLGDIIGEAVLRHNIAHILSERGRLRAATRQFEQAVQLLEERGETHHKIQFAGNRAIAEMYSGAFRTALERLNQADPRLYDQDNAAQQVWIASIRGKILTLCGNPEAALQVMEPHKPLLEKMDKTARERGFFTARYNAARAASAQKDDDAYLTFDLSPDTDSVLRFELLLGNAEIEMIRSCYDAAETIAMQALNEATESELHLKAIAARLLLAELWLIRNRADRALFFLDAEWAGRLDLSGAIPLQSRWMALTAAAYDITGRTEQARQARWQAEHLIGVMLDNVPPETNPAGFRDLFLQWRRRNDSASRIGAAAGAENGREDYRGNDMDDSKKLTMLLDISRTLSLETDMDMMLERILDYALDVTGAERGFLYLKPTGGAAAVLITRHIDRDAVLGDNPQVSISIMNDVMRTGRTVMVSDSLSEAMFKNRQSILAHNLRTVMCAPLVGRGNRKGDSGRGTPIGVLYVDGTAVGPRFGAMDRDMFNTLAMHAGIGLENLNRQLKLADENRSLKQEIQSRFGLNRLIGSSPPMLELKRIVEKIAPSGATVLITGDSGTGKELVARTIHYNSLRPDGPFVCINCASLSESVLESELFGVEAGVATGVKRRTGLFVQAHKGTLFLDEIADMPLNMQAKILRVLQERRVRPVGGKLGDDIDVRILCATNRDLWSEVKNGRFREDLLFRLDVINVHLPPLRERPEDIPVLANHFLARYAAETDGMAPRLSPATIDILQRYSWPGNVRELENQMQRVLVLTEPGQPVLPDALSPGLLETVADGCGSPLTRFSSVPLATATPDEPDNLDLKGAVEMLEKRFIEKALEQTGGNKAEAARILGVSREGLRLKMKRFGAARPDGHENASLESI
jgi:transcriptional regulator with GAF, ATPase, and Fis domain/tetratricopeptide (TPR) repeat protein